MIRTKGVFFGFPTGGLVHLPFALSLVRVVAHELSKPASERLVARVAHAAGLYVGQNRGTLVKEFLATDLDWLMIADTDTEFDGSLPELLVRIASEKGAWVIAVQVPLGAYPGTGFNRHPERRGHWICLDPLPYPGAWADGAATAVWMVHRKAIEAVEEKFGKGSLFAMDYIPGGHDDGRLLEIGEDLAASNRLRECGHRTWITSLPAVKHYKTRPLEVSSAPSTVALVEGVGEIVH